MAKRKNKSGPAFTPAQTQPTHAAVSIAQLQALQSTVNALLQSAQALANKPVAQPAPAAEGGAE